MSSRKLAAGEFSAMEFSGGNLPRTENNSNYLKPDLELTEWEIILYLTIVYNQTSSL